MEKKNTMLLTVIAVATLLVAVVGATFAYFSLTVGGNATTTKATVTTSSPGLISMTGTEETLELKLTAAEMAQAEGAYGKYYALNATDKAQAGDNVYSKEKAKNYNIAKFTLSDGADNVKYTCGYKVTITATQDLTELLQEEKQLKSGDMKVIIAGDGISQGEVDLSTLVNNTTSMTGSVELKSTAAEKYVTADLYLENRQDEQNYLADKTLGVTISVDKDEANPCKIETETP